MTTIAVIGIRGFPGVQGGVEIHSENLYPIMPDVRIRVYRRKPYLTSQSAATYPNIEYVFINDCTRDGSIEILKKLIQELKINL